jgi:hypothetical protein
MSNTSSKDSAVPTVGTEMASIEALLEKIMARLDAVETDVRAFKVSAQRSVSYCCTSFCSFS